MDNTEKIKIISLNCRGLNNSFKRKQVFRFLRKKKANIFCLQDVHFTSDQEQYIKQQWGYNEVYISPYKSNARGTAILFNNNFEFKVLNTLNDKEGNYIGVKVKISNQIYTLINIYGPSEDKPNFFNNIQEKVEALENENVILCGDWNITLNQREDTFNYKHINNPKAKKKLLEIIDTLDLKDAWRENNPQERRYTWRQPTPLKQARLDYFLISHNLLNSVVQTDICPSINSDHSVISITFSLTEVQRGKGFWKFNNSLLHDKNYVEMVKKTLADTLERYKDKKHIDEKRYSINDQLLWEMILMEIRGMTIYFSSTKKKKNKEKENMLESKLDNFEKELDSEENIDSKKIILGKINDVKLELEELNKLKTQGLFIRSKAKWIEQGEKPTKYFLHLEFRNFLNKAIRELETKDGSIITKQKDILEESRQYYKKLYTDEECTQINLNELFSEYNVPKLNDQISTALEGELLYEETLAALKKMKNEKSPGPDGFTTEFLKYFWNDLNRYLINSLNFGYKNGSLSVTQKQGLITCLPKENKPKKFLKNWRPISLLNTSYKLASATIANRIKHILPLIINNDQKGFVPGRYIGEVTRTIYDLMEYTETYQIPGLLLLIDFEKAFDSVDRKFIQNVLTFFNFGPSIKNWITTFFEGMETSVLVNGYGSSFFPITRGCRQGDPVSPYIFILCAEILALLIRKEKKIKGIKMGNIEHLLAQFADDTTLMLDKSEKGLYAVLYILQFFARFSGLKVNADKTKLIWIGSKKRTRYKLCKEWNFQWQTNFKLLGIVFDVDLEKMVELNYQEKIENINKSMNLWKIRTLTPMGRNVILKSLLLPKLNHLFSSIPSPPDEIIQELQKKCFNFVWKGKPDKIKRNVMHLLPKHGGISVPNIKCAIAAQKLSWIKKIMKNTTWLDHVTLYIPQIQKIWLADSIYIIKNVIPNIHNPFWKDVMKAWSLYLDKLYTTKDNEPELMNQCVWYNNNIKIDGNSIFYSEWYNKGITFISDFVNTNGEIHNFTEFKKEFKIESNFIIYQGLKTAITKYLQTNNYISPYSKIEQPILPFNLNNLKRKEKGSKLYYLTLLKSEYNTSHGQKKWEIVLNKKIKNEEYESYFMMPQRCTACVNLKWFQYKILHNILTTNSFLYKIGYIDSPLCSFCMSTSETLIHLLCDCPCVVKIWNEMTEWLEKISEGKIQFTTENIIFGFKGKNNNPLNAITTLVKQTIYRMSRKQTIPHFKQIQRDILNYYTATKINAFTNCTQGKFYSFWSSFHTLFKNATT